MIRRLLIIFVLLFAYASTQAQVQKGYVRTVGRPDNKEGQRLSGVQIKVRGLHGTIISDENGEFAFDLQGGDSYQLTDILLYGYELKDKEIIGRLYGFTSVPHEIVMVSLSAREKLRENIENWIADRYTKKYDELRKRLNAKEIDSNDYKIKVEALDSLYELNCFLVPVMAKWYSRTDYAVLDELETTVNAYIEAGELEKADSVIRNMNTKKLE